jgi:hypothetical protein
MMDESKAAATDSSSHDENKKIHVPSNSSGDKQDFWVKQIVIGPRTHPTMVLYLHLSKSHSNVDEAGNSNAYKAGNSNAYEAERLLDALFQGAKEQIIQAYHNEPELLLVEELPEDGTPPTYLLGKSEAGWKIISRENLRNWIRV